MGFEGLFQIFRNRLHAFWGSRAPFVECLQTRERLFNIILEFWIDLASPQADLASPEANSIFEWAGPLCTPGVPPRLRFAACRWHAWGSAYYRGS